MIIIGTYPELLDHNLTDNLLNRLRTAVESLIPPDIIIHILPPYPDSGDGGFAADDWFSIRQNLGTWKDIKDWASERKLILDGIYNHVGFAHPWVKDFFTSPSETDNLYAYRCSTPPSIQLSPRGGSVFHKYEVSGNIWHVWQTFSEKSFDICLSHPRVRANIRRHLHYLADTGIYGVRLDGCAYYGHDLSVEQFHNPNGKLLAQSLAREANDLGLFVLAQLDIDYFGASYFPKKDGWSVPAVDYAYSAMLVLTLLSESASVMETHLKRTLNLSCHVIRPPRTHDGILLQSDLLTSDELTSLEKICDFWNLKVRIVDGERYEINSSLPFICSLGVDEQTTWQRILLVIALTGFIPGIPYFYLPFVVCDIPEKRSQEIDSDPRSLNRVRLHSLHIKNFRNSNKSHQLRALLHVINKTRALYSETDFKFSVLRSDDLDSVLLISRNFDRCFFACNFSTTHSAKVIFPKKLNFVWGSCVSNQILAPLGFGIWTIDTEII